MDDESNVQSSNSINTFKIIRSLVTWQFFLTFLGWLSDLQTGNQKVTLNHLVLVSFWVK